MLNILQNNVLPGRLISRGCIRASDSTHPQCPVFIQLNPRASGDGPDTNSTPGREPNQLAEPRNPAQERPRRPRFSMASRNRTRFPGGAARPLERRDHPRSPACREPTSSIPPRAAQAAGAPRARRFRGRRVRSRNPGGSLSSMERGLAFAQARAVARGGRLRLRAWKSAELSPAGRSQDLVSPSGSAAPSRGS